MFLKKVNTIILHGQECVRAAEYNVLNSKEKEVGSMTGLLPTGKLRCPSCGKAIRDKRAVCCPKCLKLLPQTTIRT